MPADLRHRAATGRKAHRSRRRVDAARGTTPRPTPRQLDYLRALGVDGPRPIVYLAGKLEVGHHSAGEMVRRLERSGWVAAWAGRRRRRFKLVQLTGPGVLACLEANARAFGEEMRAQGIHVGLGSPPRCVVCDVPYPCQASSPASSPPCLADDSATGH